MKKSLISWSTGKDAAFSLLELARKQKLPDLLVTNLNRSKKRVSMHGVREELVRLQAQRLNIPLYLIDLDENINMEDYIRITRKHFSSLAKKGYETAFFGDIFLEDLKKFRIKEMQKAGMEAAFPIWNKNTRELAVQIIDSGIKAVVTAVSGNKLDENFAGREFDLSFLKDLPPGVDWCGENGEFHTFVYDHPLFSSPIPVKKGEKVFKKFKACTKKDSDYFDTQEKNKAWDTGFWYVDIYAG